MNKSLDVTSGEDAKQKVSDIEFVGDPDTFKLLSKAYSKTQGWMKSTKVLEIEGSGCIVQVSTQQGDNVAEALVFVPFVKLEEKDGVRRLVTAPPQFLESIICETAPQCCKEEKCCKNSTN